MAVSKTQADVFDQPDFRDAVVRTVFPSDGLTGVLPRSAYVGNALTIVRENDPAASQTPNYNASLDETDPVTGAQASFSIVKKIKNFHLDKALIQANPDPRGLAFKQIDGHARGLGRDIAADIVTGVGTGQAMNSLNSQTSASQTVYAGGSSGADGANLTIDMLHELLDQVDDKESGADLIVMNKRTRRKFYSLIGGANGAQRADLIELPTGLVVPSFAGVPIVVSDHLPINETAGSTTTTTSVYAMTLDTEGTQNVGVSIIELPGSSSIGIETIEVDSEFDSVRYRLKFYGNFAKFSDNGLARLAGVNTTNT